MRSGPGTDCSGELGTGGGALEASVGCVGACITCAIGTVTSATGASTAVSGAANKGGGGAATGWVATWGWATATGGGAVVTGAAMACGSGATCGWATVSGWPRMCCGSTRNGGGGGGGATTRSRALEPERHEHLADDVVELCDRQQECRGRLGWHSWRNGVINFRVTHRKRWHEPLMLRRGRGGLVLAVDRLCVHPRATGTGVAVGVGRDFGLAT